MSQGGLGRGLIWPILIVDFVVYLIILGLASWSLNKYIDGDQNHPHLGGNAATNYLLLFALLAGATGIVSVLSGFAHYRTWTEGSLAAASSTSAISWAITGLAFGLAWKEVKLEGRRGKRLQTLEIIIVTSTLIHLLYIMLLHAGHFNPRYGICFNKTESEGPTREAQAQAQHQPHSST